MIVVFDLPDKKQRQTSAVKIRQTAKNLKLMRVIQTLNLRIGLMSRLVTSSDGLHGVVGVLMLTSRDIIKIGRLVRDLVLDKSISKFGSRKKVRKPMKNSRSISGIPAKARPSRGESILANLLKLLLVVSSFMMMMVVVMMFMLVISLTYNKSNSYKTNLERLEMIKKIEEKLDKSLVDIGES
jgi:hypothetical protein